MDIYEYAMQMEKDGENFYRELVTKTDNSGIRRIFLMLADAEVMHYNTFTKMKSDQKIDLPDTSILKDVKNIFIELREAGELSNLKISQIELYKKAQEIEKRSEEFYLKEADEVQDEAKKQTFRRIAGEESKHYFILENIINFVSSPEQWNESAEWYHLEEY